MAFPSVAVLRWGGQPPICKYFKNRGRAGGSVMEKIDASREPNERERARALYYAQEWVIPLLKLEPGERTARVAELAQQEHEIPHSRRSRVSEATLWRLLKSYREHGLAGLFRKPRKDDGRARVLPPHLLRRAIELVLQSYRPGRRKCLQSPLWRLLSQRAGHGGAAPAESAARAGRLWSAGGRAGSGQVHAARPPGPRVRGPEPVSRGARRLHQSVLGRLLAPAGLRLRRQAAPLQIRRGAPAGIPVEPSGANRAWTSWRRS